MDGNYPTMMQSEYENAPWNEKEELETITATKTYSFSFDIPLTIPEGLDDNYELEKYYNDKYSSLEEIFNYLRTHFNQPNNKIEKTIKAIADNAVVDDSYIDFY